MIKKILKDACLYLTAAGMIYGISLGYTKLDDHVIVEKGHIKIQKTFFPLDVVKYEQFDDINASKIGIAKVYRNCTFLVDENNDNKVDQAYWQIFPVLTKERKIDDKEANKLWKKYKDKLNIEKLIEKSGD